MQQVSAGISTYPSELRLKPSDLSSQSAKPHSRLGSDSLYAGADTVGFSVVKTDVLEEEKGFWLHRGALALS